MRQNVVWKLKKETVRLLKGLTTSEPFFQMWKQLLWQQLLLISIVLLWIGDCPQSLGFQRPTSSTSSSLSCPSYDSWRFSQSSFPEEEPGEKGGPTKEDTSLSARVIRLAVRSYHPTDSKPSSPGYTTRKQQRTRVHITKEGVDEDYNHYRSLALQNTTDRAVSIVTTDCLQFLRAHGYPVQDGDLGENMLMDHCRYHDIKEGQVYTLGDRVQLEITEPMIPCANLCKLDFINQESLSPRERIDTCQEFLQLLDRAPGLRGWYAKVLQEGVVTENSSFVLLE